MTQELLLHIRRLGLASVDQYRDWCAEHGFSRGLAKSTQQRSKEFSRANAAKGLAKLRDHRERRKREQRVFANLTRASQTANAAEPLASAEYWYSSTRALEHLRAHARRWGGKLLATDTADLVLGPRPGNTFPDALRLLAKHGKHWRRPLEAWRPRTHNAMRQFRSLVRHLFAEYDEVPRFLDRVWFMGVSAQATQTRKWYLHVAAGQNIRTCDTPLPLTKKMAHHFMRAPDDASWEQALRWGQVHAMGGDERLARALFPTRLGESFEHEEFWRTVIAWLIEHPMLDTVHIGPLIDYLHHQRFGFEGIAVVNGRQVPAPPAQPNLTMKGREPETLLRQVNGWHRALAHSNRVQVRQWKPSEIPGFGWIEGSDAGKNVRKWSIRELLSGQALVTEGRQLGHCVASYAHSCAAGHCSIWTLELETRDGLSKLVTIEVRNATA
ncbi:MAG: PcfJ domain-containing protein [Pirellulaceae bacterium]